MPKQIKPGLLQQIEDDIRRAKSEAERQEHEKRWKEASEWIRAITRPENNMAFLQVQAI